MKWCDSDFPSGTKSSPAALIHSELRAQPQSFGRLSKSATRSPRSPVSEAPPAKAAIPDTGAATVGSGERRHYALQL